MSIAVVNLGLKSIRCIVFGDDGRKLATSSRPVHTSLSGVFVEQNADEWLDLLETVVLEATSSTDVDVALVTVTASASCLVLTDEAGRPTAPVVMVSDGRARHVARAIEQQPQMAAVVARTGAPVTPDLMLPKLRWWIENDRQVVDRTRRAFSPADFLTFHLTGRAVIDPNNAAKFHAFQDGDGDPGRYPLEVLDALDIPAEWLPPVSDIGTEVGVVREAWRLRLRLPPGVRVRLGTYDALSAVIGSGVSGPGRVATVFGTVTSVRLVADDDRPTGSSVVRSRWPEPDRRQAIVGGSNNLGGGLVEWHRQAFYSGFGDEVYEVMDDEVLATPAGAEALLLLPYLLGERAPVWDSVVRGMFFGVDRRHARAHFTRATYEAVAFSARHILESISEAGSGGPRFDIAASGGLARSTVLTQVLANVFQVPVFRPTEFETTALGAAIIAAWSEGLYASIESASEAMLAYREPQQPDPDLAHLYDDLFALYLALYQDTQRLTEMRQHLLEAHGSKLGFARTERENL